MLHAIDKRPVLTYETPEVKAVFDEERKQAVKRAENSFAEFEAQAARQRVKSSAFWLRVMPRNVSFESRTRERWIS